MQIIFDQLSLVNFTASKLPIRLQIVQAHIPTNKLHKDPAYNVNFTLVINNKQDSNYAQNLLDIYINLIRPFMQENEKHLDNLSEDFTRFFIFRNPLVTNTGLGKSFTNLDSADASEPHYSLPYDSIVFINEYYKSHFRNFYKFARIEASIDTILFDFNYFFCYFQPIFNRFKENKTKF